MALAENEFECANCHGVFPKAWSDEEAQAEADEVWGAALDDPVEVCDDCYQRMMGWGERTGEADKERARLAALTGRDADQAET